MFAVEVPYVAYKKTDTCKEKTIQCPLQVGRNYTFSDSVFIYQQYPKVIITNLFD